MPFARSFLIFVHHGILQKRTNQVLGVFVLCPRVLLRNGLASLSPIDEKRQQVDLMAFDHYNYCAHLFPSFNQAFRGAEFSLGQMGIRGGRLESLIGLEVEIGVVGLGSLGT